MKEEATDRQELAERLAADLELESAARDVLAEALAEVGDEHPLEQRVLKLPHVINLVYKAANEAADNMTKIKRRMERRTRQIRLQFLRAEAAGNLPPEAAALGKLNDTKRDDLIAEQRDGDAEHRTLQRMLDEADRAKCDLNLDGDELRRTLYNLRERYWQELKRATVELEHTRRTENVKA